jgi:hypothetical protein
MAPLVEIPLNSYRYNFRRLTWREEVRLNFAKTDDQRKVIMARAMVDVSGLKVTPESAMQILNHIPDALFWRIWLLYRADLPRERYFSSGGLYTAPDPVAYRIKVFDDEKTLDHTTDVAMAKIRG